MAMSEEDYYNKQIEIKNKELDSDPNAIYADELRQQRASNFLDQLNPDKVLTEIANRLKGYHRNEYTGQWEKLPGYKKEISQDLLDDFLGFLGAILNQNVSMSNFSTEEINRIMELIIDWLKDTLADNAEEYGIEEDYSEMTRIGLIICAQCFATFKIALNGAFARRVFSSMKVSANLTEDKKMGVKDALKFWN